jgi:hypothetical protein|nr:MAG TPA: hypothetical protein [Bacteriophage sp.]
MTKKNFVFSFAIPLICTIFAIIQKNKLMQTIDTYKLTSLEEPSDEILAQIMHEAALDAKHKGEEAHKRYFDQLRKMADETVQRWNSPDPSIATKQ